MVTFPAVLFKTSLLINQKTISKMNSYYNVSDWSNALRICKSYKKNPRGIYSIHDYILAKQYCSEFMVELWKIVKECSVSLKEAFALIRYNTLAITERVLITLQSWVKPIVKALTPKAISQLLRAEKQQVKESDKQDLTIRVRVKRYWNRQEHKFHRQSIMSI
jgi:hypothetical protein